MLSFQVSLMTEDSKAEESMVAQNAKVAVKGEEKIKPVIAALTAQGQFGSSWTGIPFNYIVAKPKK